MNGIKLISDDTIVYSKTLEKHFQHAEKWFANRSAKRTNLSKCEFMKNEIKLIWVKHTKKVVKLDEDKITVMLVHPT